MLFLLFHFCIKFNISTMITNSSFNWILFLLQNRFRKSSGIPPIPACPFIRWLAAAIFREKKA